MIERRAERAVWRSIVALNAASALAQLGQYGIAFMLYPLALEAAAVPAWQIGIASSAGWVGMVLGLVLAPRAIARVGQRRSVVAGLAASAVALALTPWLPHGSWALAAAVSGFGMGLRWIGNETWLYAIAPGETRGRIVGVHETLLGISAVAGPAAIAALGVSQAAPFVLAAVATAAAAAPLLWADIALLDDDPAAGAVAGPTADLAGPTADLADPADPADPCARADPAARAAPASASASASAPASASASASAPAPAPVPASASGRREPLPGRSRLAAPARGWRSLGLGSLIAAVGGLMEGAFLAAFPVYASQAGFDSAEAAWLLTVFGIGAMLLQFPLGALSDARGLMSATRWTALASAVSAAVLGAASLGSVAVAAWLFVLGGAITGFLTLGLVAATQQADPARLVGEVSRVSIAYTAASAIGPLVVGALVSGLGGAALMGFIAASAAVLGLGLRYWRVQRSLTTA